MNGRAETLIEQLWWICMRIMTGSSSELDEVTNRAVVC